MGSMGKAQGADTAGRRVRVYAVLAILLALFSGCARPDAEADFHFDGDGAFRFVEEFIMPAGEPRYRVPNTTSHDEAGVWLFQAMQMEGWDVRWQNFTGAEYAVMDKGQVSSYYTSPGACSDAERVRLATLRFSNLVATFPGPEDPERAFYMGAHWDSKKAATQDPDPESQQEPVLGANDGASGVGVLLQFMRHVSQGDLSFPFTVGVVFFDGEDGFEDCHPLAGSIAFVASVEAGEADVDRFLLLDMVGDPEARFVHEMHSAGSDPDLLALIESKAPEAGLEENFPGTERQVYDDHIPFIDAGIPAVDLIDFGRSPGGFPPYWHTTRDTLDKLDAGMLGRVGQLIVATMQDQEFVDSWPA
jgi:Zn-dependent M28 family amino/carboxypeptidase